MGRYELSDFEWTRIEPHLPNKPRTQGGGAKTSRRGLGAVDMAALNVVTGAHF